MTTFDEPRFDARHLAAFRARSAGFRDIMIFGYIDQTDGARANSSECLACMRRISR